MSMPTFSPKDGPFREPDVSRNNKDRMAREVSKALEAEYGKDPTQESIDFGTPETAEGLTTDPMSYNAEMHTSGSAAQPSGDDGGITSKRTNGADPTPAKPGA